MISADKHSNFNSTLLFFYCFQHEGPRRRRLVDSSTHLLTNLVYEDDGWQALPGRREESPHQHLPLAHQLAGQAAGGDVEEGRGGLGGHGAGQHRLAVTCIVT